jgi:hypothetical protein
LITCNCIKAIPPYHWMWTITNTYHCPWCAHEIHPSNIQTYIGDSLIYQFRCLNIKCDRTHFFKCRICKPSYTSKAPEARRLITSIKQHLTTKTHLSRKITHGSKNNNNNGIGNDPIANSMGGIIDGRLEDLLDLSLVDLDESNIGAECDDCPNLDYSYDDTDVNDDPPNPS